jgi:hypothetical protein
MSCRLGSFQDSHPHKVRRVRAGNNLRGSPVQVIEKRVPTTVGNKGISALYVMRQWHSLN